VSPGAYQLALSKLDPTTAQKINAIVIEGVHHG
jgi:hypothetical protein